MYRQVTIGITEKHVREVYTLFNRYDDQSASADKNAVFAWQSGHRPMERGATYGLDGAYPYKLQPSLLRVYEWASTRWHEFIQQASKIAESRDSRSSPNNPKKTVITIPPPVPDVEQHDIGHKHALSTTPVSWLCVDGYARVLPEHMILVCLLCKAGILPGASAASHFSRNIG